MEGRTGSGPGTQAPNLQVLGRNDEKGVGHAEIFMCSGVNKVEKAGARL